MFSDMSLFMRLFWQTTTLIVAITVISQIIGKILIKDVRDDDE